MASEYLIVKIFYKKGRRPKHLTNLREIRKAIARAPSQILTAVLDYQDGRNTESLGAINLVEVGGEIFVEEQGKHSNVPLYVPTERRRKLYIT